MSSKSIRREASDYFVPFLLGSNPQSHFLSFKIFHKYDIVPYVLNSKRTALDIIDPTSRFFPLSPSSDSLLFAEQLISVADKLPYTLPILIPCTPEYRAMAEAERERLETHFVICDPEELFLISPLVSIP